jgi:RNA-directed DNA polymerase
MPTSVTVLNYEKFTVRHLMRKTQMSSAQAGCASKTRWTDWHSINWKKVRNGVKSLQRRIVKAVETKHFHKAKVLVHLLVRSFYGKLLAILRVTTNQGSKTCGVDNILWNTPAKRWKAIEQLSVRRYKAEPLKRKSIPKKNGKLRHLGIPTMKDRAIQALYKSALEPIAETTADLNSYGFRPRRSCADAIEQCFNVLANRNSAEWIFEADIKGCFDNISHEWIMQYIPLSEKVLTQWLRCGYIDNKNWFPTESGTPQGGIISPVIANMVLDGLEKVILFKACPKHYDNGRRNNPQKVNFIRYADDFIVSCANREYLEREIKPLIREFLASRGLELSEEKSKITHINEGFDFLGFNIRKYNGKCLIKPSKKSVIGIYQSIRESITNNKAVTQETLICLLSPKIIGWANFFRHVVSKRTFAVLDGKLFLLLWKWAKRKHPNKSSYWIKNHYFVSKGNQNWAFASTGNKKQIVLPRFDATKIVRHTKIINHSNPFNSKWDNYFAERGRKRLVKLKNSSKLVNDNDRTAMAV